jgi:hypothetical protein
MPRAMRTFNIRFLAVYNILISCHRFVPMGPSRYSQPEIDPPHGTTYVLGSQREKADGATSPRSRAWRSLRSSPFGSSAWLDVRKDAAAKDIRGVCLRRRHCEGMRQDGAQVHRQATIRGSELGGCRLGRPGSHTTGAGTTYEKTDGSLSLAQGAVREAHREKRPTNGGPPSPRRHHGLVFGVSKCSLLAYHLLRLVLWRPIRSGEGFDFRRHFTPSEDIYL